LRMLLVQLRIAVLQYWTGAVLLCLGYTIVLMGTAERSLPVATLEAVANVAPPAVLGLLAASLEVYPRARDLRRGSGQFWLPQAALQLPALSFCRSPWPAPPAPARRGIHPDVV